MANGSWQRTRDTRSVEPSGPPNRQYKSEKVQSKPPSGRRHSTVGVEYDNRRHKAPNLPPRLLKKIMDENKMNHQQPNTMEEVWDGSSLMFQGSNNPLKNPSYHHMNCMTGGQQQLDNNAGYYTLPNRPRGRGRLQNMQDYEHGGVPGFRSPCNSRPGTPPVRYDSRPQTPLQRQNEEDYRNSNDRNDNNQRRGYLDRRKSESREMIDRRFNNKRRDTRRRRYNRRDTNANQSNKFDDDFEQRSDRDGDTTPTPQQIDEFSESLEAQLSPVSPEIVNEEKTEPINHIAHTYDKALVSLDYNFLKLDCLLLLFFL